MLLDDNFTPRREWSLSMCYVFTFFSPKINPKIRSRVRVWLGATALCWTLKNQNHLTTLPNHSKQTKWLLTCIPFFSKLPNPVIKEVIEMSKLCEPNGYGQETAGFHSKLDWSAIPAKHQGSFNLWSGGRVGQSGKGQGGFSRSEIGRWGGWVWVM